ncbi:hypothetical protein D9758_002461 [Tetrapyrgos nigripes]|uniref:Enoyl reductase (ER) domain-containing protein n=1 Tax=Tetrapyrgos nigripes TaxID=182062 RepID=A0A8H5LT26_9AGAR|nr:hypothetical protein D9758_002461 [Tetrapyrgos nigripes]
MSMNAFVYRGPGKAVVEQRPTPTIQKPTDAVVKMLKTTICGTDLHILKGDVPTCAEGRILGHEGIGIVESVGAAVNTFKPGDNVIIAALPPAQHANTAVAVCLLTVPTVAGIPYADTSLHSANVKGVSKEALVMISDALPTGYECGTLNGNVQPGSSVAVIVFVSLPPNHDIISVLSIAGGGPVGLSALLTAQFFSPSQLIMIDLDENRLATAKSVGATHTVKSGPDTVKQILDITGGRGVDTVIEAVGVPKTFELCQDIVAVGGTIANVGVHGTKADIHLERLWSMNLTIRTRLVDAITIPQLIKIVEGGRVDPQALLTHTFKFSDVQSAYGTFGAAAKNNALKVVINFD